MTNSTPLIREDKAYYIGCLGMIFCLDAINGDIIWTLDIFEEFKGECPMWGFGSSPVIAAGNLIVQTGCPDGKSIAALDLETGDVVWSSLDAPPNNATPLPFEFDGVEQIAIFVAGAKKKDSGRAVGLSAADGEELWSFSWETAKPYYTTPIFSKGKILGGSHGDEGATVFKLAPGSDGIASEKVWKSKDFQPWFGTSVLIDGYVYGFDKKKLKCFEFDTGKEMWAGEGYDRGQIIAADGKLIVLGETGKVGLIEATPGAFREISSFQGLNLKLDKKSKNHTIPSVANGKLYLRNWKEIACFDLKP